jgi:hypothetical protein
VLEHAAACSDCRAVLAEHSSLADELLLAAPEHEPPAGFEWRAIERLKARAPRGLLARLPRGRALRLATAAAAILAVVSITVATMVVAFSDDQQKPRNLHSLSGVKGEFFNAAQLVEPSGAPAGEVFGYSPSWLLVKVDREYASDSYRCELLTRSGKRIQLDAFRLDRVSGTWGQQIPVDLREVAEVRVYDGDKDGPLRARFTQQ